ncbi:hypothetical protein EYF80_059746 [Liparis tanakae]|uniref:Uncharacterized protein n=1 Tax=Liparis tanakae TaxID=230148 RepID=A0A4Z2EMV6_9TELE|nr:hypothetical protein EYF80_059746 [Liparis tanakae]
MVRRVLKPMAMSSMWAAKKKLLKCPKMDMVVYQIRYRKYCREAQGTRVEFSPGEQRRFLLHRLHCGVKVQSALIQAQELGDALGSIEVPVFVDHLNIQRHKRSDRTIKPRLGGPRLCDPRGVDDEAIPLALDVVVRRLLRDVETVELQLPGDVLLPLEHHQRDLEANESRRGTRTEARRHNAAGSVKTSAAVVAEHADEGDDRVEDGQEAQRGQHVAAALVQDKLVHVEEGVQTVVLLAVPRLLLVYLFPGFTGDLRGAYTTYSMNGQGHRTTEQRPVHRSWLLPSH